jgi:hypothetical protein
MDVPVPTRHAGRVPIHSGSDSLADCWMPELIHRAVTRMGITAGIYLGRGSDSCLRLGGAYFASRRQTAPAPTGKPDMVVLDRDIFIIPPAEYPLQSFRSHLWRIKIPVST